MNQDDDQMYFSTHLAREKINFIPQNHENNRYFTHQAQHNHALSVWGGSQKLIFKVLMLSGEAMASNSKIHLQYGLGRRTRTIWQTFRYLYQHIPPDREHPLSMDDAIEASTMLNSLYINVRGALDNFAFCLLDLFSISSNPKLRDQQVGLFNLAYLKQPGFEKIRGVVDPFSAWNNDFKNRRDPAAHRVPLAILPAIHTRETLLEHDRIELQIDEKMKEAAGASRALDHETSLAKFAEIEKLRAQQEKVGKFEPCFQFDPGYNPIYLYPTVSDDVGTFVVIARKLLNLVEVAVKR